MARAALSVTGWLVCVVGVVLAMLADEPMTVVSYGAAAMAGALVVVAMAHLTTKEAS